MDEKSLIMLEFPKVREILAGYTSFPVSRELALSLKPLSDYRTITLLLKQCSEARHLQTLAPDFRIGTVDDVQEAAELAARGKQMDPPTLATIARTLATIRHLRTNLNKYSNELPSIWEISGSIIEMRPLEKSINDCISPDGELLDSASPELVALRHQVQARRQQLITSLEGIMRSPGGQKIVQEPIVTEREGRYVIPVKVEAKREIHGIIHDVSNTGATVFMEPWEAVEQGNELRELINEEKREIDRILRRLSDDVGIHAKEITDNITLAAELDFIFAKAEYARRNRANEPIITPFGSNGESAVLRLIEARHPLLGDRAVPLSVELGKDYSVLVITGPNTGGKTVALKSIGLLSLMALAGLPIPASEESQIPLFDGVFVDIGDEQSIEQTLSTFSWHIGNITRITHNVTGRSLVLLDELGTSTDPAEGSALARSILLHFLSKSTLTVATTHLGDLKAFAYVTPGLQNASLDFNPVTFAPNYHLTVGLPGGSNALETAARLGLAEEIVAHAREMLSAGTQEVEALIANLTEERDKTQALRVELEQTRQEAERLKQELEKELKELKFREKTLIQETRDKVVREAADLQREIRQASIDLRKQKSKESIEHTRTVLASLRERLKSETWQESVSPAETQTELEGPISPGDTVWLKEASLEAKVVYINEDSGEIEVQAGQTRIRLGLDGVERIVPSEGDEPGRFVPVVKPPKKVIPSELLLIGKRAEEVENLLNRYLDDASLSNLSQVRIVHGSGTGTLRRIVRELLSTHQLVKSYRPGERGEGGNGVTVVKL